MKEIVPNTHILDLDFLGYREAIGPALLQGGSNLVMIDCGPASSLASLREELAHLGLRVADLTHLLLTHIHLDHAGATGTLLRENPRLRVYVHEKGAPHMVNPEKLLRSAGRLYGDKMQQMYGEFLPSPEASLDVLRGGEKLHLAGRSIEVEYTPGHASHHVSFFDQSTGIAYIGDTTGCRYPRSNFVCPVTPPPDIALDLWRSSLDRVAARKPAQLFLTHYGPFRNVEEHLDQAWSGIQRWAQSAKQILDTESDEPGRGARFVDFAAADFRGEAAAAAWYRGVGNPMLSWLGLARYWAKQDGTQVAV